MAVKSSQDVECSFNNHSMTIMMIEWWWWWLKWSSIIIMFNVDDDLCGIFSISICITFSKYNSIRYLCFRPDETQHIRLNYIITRRNPHLSFSGKITMTSGWSFQLFRKLNSLCSKPAPAGLHSNQWQRELKKNFCRSMKSPGYSTETRKCACLPSMLLLDREQTRCE